MLENLDGFLKKLQTEKPLNLTFRAVLGHGHSAAAFLAESPTGELRAVKIYDSPSLAKFGQSVQKERLERELTLRGHSCPDLVQIFDGGDVAIDGSTYSFVTMEYVEGQDFRARLDKGDRLSDGDIRKFLGSLVRAAAFLEARGFCHRDIKTDNCRLRTDGTLILLDLGVIKPVGQSDMTDAQERFFVGTRRYASPEFLLRREADTVEGWRALTIYQIGAVLYEMIEGTRLFSYVREPEAELVRAVLSDRPEILRNDVGQDLCSLAKACLAKDPQERLKIAPWEALERVASAPTPADVTASRIDFSHRMRAAAERYIQTVEVPQQAAEERARLRVRSFEIAQKGVIKALGTVLGQDAKSAVGVVQTGEHHYVRLVVPENLKIAFPFRLYLICRIVMDSDALESAAIHGIGAWGEMPYLGPPNPLNREADEDRMLRWLEDRQLTAQFNVIWSGSVGEDEITGSVGNWSAKMIDRYLTLTESDLSAMIEEKRKQIDGSHQGWTARPRRTSIPVFNLENHIELNIQPGPSTQRGPRGIRFR